MCSSPLGPFTFSWICLDFTDIHLHRLYRPTCPRAVGSAHRRPPLTWNGAAQVDTQLTCGINVVEMGSSETKEQKKINSGQPTTNYTGHQAAGRSLTLQPRRRKQPSRLKKRPASIDGSTGLWDNYDPSRRRYLETDLDLYNELQNHLENARQRMRDKGRKDAVSGGLSTSLVSGQEKCYDPNDSTLTFVDGDDDMDFECNNYKSLRARMSCGHSVTPMSLTNWCQQLLDQGESRFVCGQTGCNAEWSYEEVCKMALLTPEEKEYFENKMFSSAAKDYLDVKAVSVSR